MSNMHEVYRNLHNLDGEFIRKNNSAKWIPEIIQYLKKFEEDLDTKYKNSSQSKEELFGYIDTKDNLSNLRIVLKDLEKKFKASSRLFRLFWNKEKCESLEEIADMLKAMFKNLHEPKRVFFHYPKKEENEVTLFLSKWISQQSAQQQKNKSHARVQSMVELGHGPQQGRHARSQSMGGQS